MEVIREGGSDSLKNKKKHKKRKDERRKRRYDEHSVLGGDDGNLELDDQGRRKKSKTEGLSDADCVVSADDKSKKVERKKGRSGVSGEERKSEKRKRKEKEIKGGDEVGVLNELEAWNGMRDGEEFLGRAVSNLDPEREGNVCEENGEIEGGKNSEDGIKKSDNFVVGVATDTELMSGGEEHISELAEVKKLKKKLKKKAKKKGKNSKTDLENTEADIGYMVERPGFVGKKIVRDVAEKFEPVQERKKKDGKKIHAPEDEDQKKEKDTHEVRDRIKHGGAKKYSKSKKSVACNKVKHANMLTDSPDTFGKSNPKSRKVKFDDRVEVIPLGPDDIVDANNSIEGKDGSDSSKGKDGSDSSEGKDGSNSSEGEEDRVNGGYSSEGEECLADGSYSSKGKKKKKLEDGNDGVIQGKRFSKEEDEILRVAVLKYVEDNQLGEEGVEMIMKCRQHRKKVKDCWKEIAEALPWRTRYAVYSRAHILFERGESRKWTKEELEMVLEFHQKHGPKWRELADEMKRHRVHVKDAFRQVKLPNKKMGHWSQEEYQSLFDLVNKDLRMKVVMDKKSQHGMLRDNIGWETISRLLSTRTDPVCCQKWYNQLTSPLVARGEWSDADDYRLVMALVDLDATCDEDVEWDNLVENRSGYICRKRWIEMVRHIGEHGTKSFSEQVDLLSQRYCRDVLEAREAYDNKPVVD